jgi:protein CpxP
MNKQRFLIILVLGLMLSNALLFFLFMNEHRSNRGPKTTIIDQLNFDDEQVKAYEVFIHHHRSAIDSNEEKMNMLRDTLYEQLNFTHDSVKIDSLIEIVSQQQYLAEKINYTHFLAIKKLCKPNQEKAFEQLTHQISYLFFAKERK